MNAPDTLSRARAALADTHDVINVGRELADYAWIEARRTGDAGWCGVAIAGGDPTQRCSIGVICAEDSWLAVALGNC